MLQFFRRYQKIVFFFVTIVVVISFCFFGTYGTLASREEGGDKEIGMGMMGKPLFAREYRALSLLLSSSVWDRSSRDGIGNLLNPGIIERDFLANGLGAILVKPYFAKMKQELDVKAKKIQSYRPYTHPASADVGLEKLFSLFSPSFAPTYFQLKARSDQATMETWMLLSQLYLEQAALPPMEMIRQFLLMQENQMGLVHDEGLSHTDLSLFGFKTIEDWFGPQFLSLVTSAILQVAQVAEERGYDIPNEEVREELFTSIRQGYEKVLRKKEIPSEDVQKYYVGKMRSLGLDEDTLLRAWRKVMLFERVFDEVGGSVYLDPLAMTQFEEFVQEKCNVEMYILPAYLQFKDFLSLCKFQLYLDSISPEGASFRKNLELPQTFFSLEQVEKRSPELISQQVQIEWRSVSMDDLTAKVSLQETLRWQQENWGRLEQHFAIVKGKEGLDDLQSLSLEDRRAVDRFAQEEIVKGSKDLVALALAQKPMLELSGNLSRNSALFSRLNLHNEEILKLIQDASPLQGEMNEASRQLRQYTVDQKNFYEIIVLFKDSVRDVITFSEALKEGIIDRMFEQYLEKMYPEARKKNLALFQKEDGKFKPVSQVQKEVASILFADLVQTISKTPFYAESEGSKDVLQLCARLAFFKEVAKVHDRITQGQIDSLSFYTNNAPSCVRDLLLEQKTEEIARSAPSLFSKQEIFSQELLEWSSVKRGEKGAIGFYRVVEKQKEGALPFAELAQGHQMLGEDAKRNLMTTLLKKMHQEGNIDLLSYAD